MLASLRQATIADIPNIWDVRQSVTENTLTRDRLSDEGVRREIEDTGRGWVIDPLRTASDDLVCHDTNPLTVKTQHGSIA